MITGEHAAYDIKKNPHDPKLKVRKYINNSSYIQKRKFFVIIEENLSLRFSYLRRYLKFIARQIRLPKIITTIKFRFLYVKGIRQSFRIF